MTNPRRVRFALQLRDAPTGAAWLDLARHAEDAGYAVVSMPDHLDGQLAPIPALAAAAAVTRRVGLSMFVLANDHRQPAVLAKEVATLDVLSGGRVELGIGAGWMESEYRALGVPFDAAGVRIERLAESIGVLRGLLSGETFSHHGRYYDIAEHRLYPRPDRRIPIVLGGGGRKMLSLAAREADIVSIATNNRDRQQERGPGGMHSRDAVRRQVEWVRDAAGARFEGLELNVRVMGVAITDDPQAGAEQLAPTLGTTPEALLDSPFVFVGDPSRVADRIRQDRDELGISYFTVSQRHMDQLDRVVATMSGA